MEKNCKVAEDIKSHGKNGKIYAKKSDTCRVIFKMDNVWLLENIRTGEKFSCHVSKILIE